MILNTIIARHADGLFLAENLEGSDDRVAIAKRKIKQLLKASIAYEEDHLRKANVDNLDLFYKMHDGVIYMALCEKNYPIKLANSFLEELHAGFQQEVRSHYGTSVDYRSKIETIEEPYYFLKFDKFIKKLKTEFQDVKSNANMERLKTDLTDVQDVLAQSIDMLINRDSKLQDTLGKTSKLKEDSKKWKDKTKKLEWDMWVKRNMIWFVLVLVVVLFLIIKFVL